MRLKRDRFNKVTNRAAPPVVEEKREAPEPRPIVAEIPKELSDRLGRLEGMISLLRPPLKEKQPAVVPPPVVVQPQVNEGVIHQRLMQMENSLRKLVDEHTGKAKWLFQVNRDRAGKIVSVEATKNTETD